MSLGGGRASGRGLRSLTTNPHCWSFGHGLQFLVVRLAFKAIVFWCAVGLGFDYGTCSPLQVIRSSVVVTRAWSLTITVSSLFRSDLHLNRAWSFLYILYSYVGCFCRDEGSFFLVLISVCPSKVLGC